MNSVTEKIDERILRLLSLDDVFDLDYDTYLTLLKEAIVTGANKLPQEELAMLSNERRRIRGKKGRFKPQKEKVAVNKVSTTKFLKASKKTLALPFDSTIQQQDLTGIGKPLESISKTLAAFLKFSKKNNEEERKDREFQKRSKREESLEGFKKGISAVSSAAKKMLAPFQSIIDRIWRFISFTLLGRAFTQFMSWLGDPKNKGKIEVLGRFLKDWWPTLLGAAVLFFTPFGKFVRSTLKLVGFLAGRLVKAIPQISRAVAGLGRFAIGNPLLTIGATTAAATFGSEMWRQGEEKKQLESEAKRRGVNQEVVKLELEEAKRSPFAIFGEAMQNIGSFAKGGSILNLNNGYGGIDGNTGQKVSGFGPDTQMIVAQPGEVVMNKKAVNAIGADTLLGWNRQFGGPGANKPKMGRLYNTGGMVGYEPKELIGNPVKLTKAGVSKLPYFGGFRRQTGTLDMGGTRGAGLGGGTDAITKQSKEMYFGDRLKKLFFGKPKYGYDPQEYNGGGLIETKQNLNFVLPGLGGGGGGTDAITKQSKEMYFGDRLKKLFFGKPKYGYDPQEYNGGGLIGRKATELVNIEMPNTIRDYYEQIQDGFISPMSFEDTKKLIEEQKKLKIRKLIRDYQNMPRRNGGGPIKENTGKNIPGATADRQLIAAQPGEYILPVDTVSHLGTSLIDKIVSLTDSNSNAAKLGHRTKNIPKITPLSRSNSSNVMTLPPITQSASGGISNNNSAGSRVPTFSAVSPSGGSERSINAGIYGIVG
jgi:hypothetical protein